MKYNLIIPSAGSGNRFVNSNYKTYKPFIEIFGKRMIDHITGLFPFELHVIVVAAESKRELFTYAKFAENITIVYIQDHKNGPAYSIYKIQHLLNSDEAYFVSYNDIVWTWNFSEVHDFIKQNNPDGLVFTHKGFHPHLFKNNFSAFCKTQGNEILEIREKNSFTDDWMNEYLSIGAFYFKTGEYLISSIASVVENTENVAGEFYPSVAYNYLINLGLRIEKYDVSSFVHWGVPEQLEDVLRWKRIFYNRSNETKINICLMMCGTGERMKTISSVNKAGIEVSNDIKMYQYVISKYGIENVWLIVNDFVKEIIETSEKIINIGKQTISQTDSLYNAIPYIRDMQQVIFTSNDCFGQINYKELDSLNDADIVLFGFKPSLLQQKQDCAHTYFEYFGDTVMEIRIKEKTHSGYGLAGLFYVPDASIFDYLVGFDVEENPSFDHFVKHLLTLEKKVKFVEIKDYVHLGTPEEFNEFLYWQKFYEKN